ncbi:2-octaprenyl-6-methoxyphenyl hydroxylase, partial [Gammaproteobacteria bacterium]|nr:2-octaprenyl-6-methoxyphenyl hydroxylase [Gammaproteobacteria bacterium]
MENHFDVAIVGGGLVGASLACALAGTDLRVVVIEAVSRKSQSQAGYDDRVLAIAPGSRTILDTIGIWRETDPESVVPIRTIHISDRGKFGFARLHHARHGVEAMGYAVPARELGVAMDRKLQQLEGVTMMCPAEVTGLTRTKSIVEIYLSENSNPAKVRASLVVFADGADSAMRRSLDFETVDYKYNQSVVLTTVTPDRTHNNTAYERFTDTGPLALLPSSNNRYTVVWTVEDEQVPELLQCADDDFLQRLQFRFGDRVGEMRKLGRRKTYPLSFVKVKHPVKRRVVVVGNAAHTIHPVAGQGFNLGLRDVASLAEVLFDAQGQGLDVGMAEVLDRYWRLRQRD